MSERLNSIIKFDLHIHSKASGYKESPGIVEYSTKENLEILLSQLNQHNVSLFSITDHNRFDVELYLEINRILSKVEHPYTNVKSVLAGVEFDVIFDEDMKQCHIIAIFDTDNEENKYRKIEAGIKSNIITEKGAAYSKEDFQNILKEIGLNTILIASQKKNIYNHSGSHRSLSDSTKNVEHIIRVGYIDALEFQKPKVEGILYNNLKYLSLPIPLFSGSDCHDWSCYPYHDKQNKNREFRHSKAKILPTFKGLLMAITSPETRFNCSENLNTKIVDSLQILNQEIPLVNGINAIIGENGSGKSTLLKLINGKTSEKHVNTLVKENDLKANCSTSPLEIKYIEQGEIIKKFNENKLFSVGDECSFKEFDNMPFKEAYLKYSNALKKGIEASIKKQETLENLKRYFINYEEDMITKNYYVDITSSKDFGSAPNPHDQAKKDISSLLKKLCELIDDNYYKQYNEQLTRLVKEIKKIKNDVESKWNTFDYEIKVKNIMNSHIRNYLLKVRKHSTSKDRDIKEYKNKIRQTVDAVLEAIQSSMEDIIWPKIPEIMAGITIAPKQGFYFNREAAYNGVSMINNYIGKMFNKPYSSFEKIEDIDSYEKFYNAIRNCSSIQEIDKEWSVNFEKFMSEATKTSDYITDGAKHQIGNTLGEMSLSYYEFYTQDDKDWQILIVDQPEDNISNNNINKKLISYFNAIRDKKQIIFVTHNPLLVVNLDVDNVIFIENNNGMLNVSSGCLEYESKKTNILELIAQNMDGGKETIEKRLKVYGKNY